MSPVHAIAFADIDDVPADGVRREGDQARGFVNNSLVHTNRHVLAVGALLSKLLGRGFANWSIR